MEGMKGMGIRNIDTGFEFPSGSDGFIPFIPFIPVNTGSWIGEVSIPVLTGMEGMKGMGIRNIGTGFEFP